MNCYTTGMSFRNLIVCLTITSLVNCDILKSSLTFVIDDTYSMSEEINGVKEESRAIFEVHRNSPDSQIENFIIVTFNDPDYLDGPKNKTEVRTITKKHSEYLDALKNIKIHGGGDCPEYSMSGIQTAIKASLPGSYLYVFTDASAKDYDQADAVTRMAQEKQCQIIFVLTGCCIESEHTHKCVRTEPDYMVYQTVANATNGQVFEMKRSEIKEILKYVEHNIKGHKEIIGKFHFPPGHHTFDVNVSDTEELTVSVSGSRPSIGAKGPDGAKPPINVIVETEKSKIVGIETHNPGKYDVNIHSKTDSTVVVERPIDFQFSHGFSVQTPPLLLGSSTRPVSGTKSSLLVHLHGKTTDLLNVISADLVNLNGKMINSIKMIGNNNADQYVSLHELVIPKEDFIIIINVIDRKTEKQIKRRSNIPITPIKPEEEPIKRLNPTVTIEGDKELDADVNSTLELKCRVRAYPTPKIVWKDNLTHRIRPSIITSESVYDHTSSLRIEHFKKNATFRCVALNDEGENYSEVKVNLKPYFIITERPKDSIIKFENQGTLTCKADASPKAEVTWTHQQLNVSDEPRIAISEDGTELTIKQMDFKTIGNYICVIQNSNNRSVNNAKVSISGAARPKISTNSLKNYIIFQNNPFEITCNVTSGEPTPSVKWFYRRNHMDNYVEIEYYRTLQIKHVQLADSGHYKCVAANKHGHNSRTWTLRVESPPAIEELDETRNIKVGEKVVLKCTVTGKPRPKVFWYSNGTKIRPIEKYNPYKNDLYFTATINDTGIYTCEASNKYDITQRMVFLRTYEPIELSLPAKLEISKRVGDYVSLSCVAKGYPPPKITWIFWKDDTETEPVIIKSHTPKLLTFKAIQLKEQGHYTCIAENYIENKNMTYFVKVYTPPTIINVKERQFSAVVGDEVLYIPCETSGSPKPTVTWQLDDHDLAAGSDWYDMPNGTLAIKNIDKISEGTYICYASNAIGDTSEAFEVVVEDFPKNSKFLGSVTVVAGKSIQMDCPLKETIIDRVTWFKDESLISTGDLTLYNVQEEDAGMYTCRVSSIMGRTGRSGEILVHVESPPEFLNAVNTNIKVKRGNTVKLDCSTAGNPKPQVTWWYDGQELNEHKDILIMQTYHLRLLPEVNYYSCVAKNRLSSKIRKFTIKLY